MRGGSVLKEAERNQDKDSDLLEMEFTAHVGQRFGVPLRILILWTEN